VSRLLGTGQLAEAAAAYKRLADEHPTSGGLTTLSRKSQYDLANHFYATGDHAAAVYAYERFLEAYPKDPEAAHIRLLLGRVNARYLNDPVRAKALLIEAIAGLRDEDSRAMAKKELEALG
jgi:outer membrane protein assembly factor BamD (BamD/ComL family)